MDVWLAAAFYGIAVALTAWVVVMHRRDQKLVAPVACGAVVLAIVAGYVLMSEYAAGPRDFAFYALSFTGVAAGFLLITARHPIHGALWLMLTILSASGTMILMHAEFVATAQMFLFAGVIVLTYIASIMMVEVTEKPAPDLWLSQHTLATFAIMLLFGGVCVLVATTPEDTLGAAAAGINHPISTIAPASIAADDDGGRDPGLVALGESIFTEHAFAFLVAGLLLTVGLISGVYLTRPEKADDSRSPL